MKTITLAEANQPTVTADGIVLPPTYLLSGSIGLGFAAVAWLIKRELANSDRRIHNLESRVSEADHNNERLEDRLSDLKADLPRQYVHREDWVRFGTNLEAKLDAVHRRLDSILKDR